MDVYQERKARYTGKKDKGGKGLSGVQKPNEVVNILTSDWHMSDTPPISRSIEEDWFEVMGRNLDYLDRLQQKYECPITIAGDVFHKWKCSPALINFLIKRMPKGPIYAVPGQHDLPNHEYSRIHESAYWTLVEAGKIINLEVQHPVKVNGVWLHGIPWGFEVQRPTYVEKPNGLHVAVIHSYIWIKGSCYTGAPEKQRLKRYLKTLEHYDAAVFGDNHKGFLWGKQKPYILNAGTLMRRNIDEEDYMPQVGLLERSGKITPWNIPCETDQFIDMRDPQKIFLRLIEATEFLKELTGVSASQVFDFVTAVERYCEKNKVKDLVKNLIVEILETDE